jgi:hypothetical protein
MKRVSAVADGFAEAARWRLLGLLLERPRPGWHEEVARLAFEIDDPALCAVARSAARASEGTYLRLLGPGGAAPAREVGYAGLRDPGWVLANVRRYYDAFGFAPRAEDPVDHVAVEVGFVGYLHLKEALARAESDERAGAVTATARAEFLRAHLATIAAPLARRLTGDDSHLAAAAELLAARVPAAPEVAVPGEDPLAGGCGACGAARAGDAFGEDPR